MTTDSPDHGSAERTGTTDDSKTADDQEATVGSGTTDDGSALPFTRRRLLAGLGSAGAAALVGQQITSANDSEASKRETRWTARRRLRLSADLEDVTEAGVYDRIGSYYPDVGLTSFDDQAFTGLTDQLVELPDDGPAIKTVDQVATLHYLGAAWDPYSNPSPSESNTNGAWQHTFALNVAGVSQRLQTSVYDLIDGAQSAEESMIGELYGLHPGLELQPGVEVRTIPTALVDGDADLIGDRNDDQGPEHVAVSARRDRDRFGFLSPSELSQVVRDGGDLDEVLDLAATNPDDAIADYAALQQARYDAADRRDDFGAGKTLVTETIGLLGGSGGQRAGSGGTTGSLASFAKFTTDVQGYAGVIESVAGAIDEVTTDPDVDRDYFFSGFEQWLTGSGPVSAGYVTFDVYVAPDKRGAVAVGARNRLSSYDVLPTDESSLAALPRSDATWAIDIQGLPAPGDRMPGRDERNTATVARLESGMEAPGGTSYPYRDLSAEDRPMKPAPSITPQVEGALSVGDAVTVDAHDTALCSGPIQSHDWAIYQLELDAASEAGYAPVGDPYAEGSGAEFAPTVESPGDLGLQRVELTVDDGRNTATTHRDFFVGEASAPEAAVTVETSPRPNQELRLSGTASTAPSTVEDYQWTIIGRPDDAGLLQLSVLRGTGPEFAVTPESTGEYTVFLEIEDAVGITATTSRTITVTEGWAPVTVDYSPEHPSPDDEVTLEASVGGDAGDAELAYVWYGEPAGTTEREIGTGAEITIGSANYEEFRVVASDGQGNSDSQTFTIPVEAPVARVEHTPEDPAPGEDVTLDASGSTDPDGQPLDYVWYGKPAGTSRRQLSTEVETTVGAGQFERFDLVVTDEQGYSDSVRFQIGPSGPSEPIDGTVPQDLDDDGVYVDLNANDRTDSDDVVTYFDHYDEPVMADNPSYYDLNGNNRTDADDVVTLFESL